MVLVTGGTGLVGSHLLYSLIKKEDSIRAIYRDKHTLKAVKHVFSYYTNDIDSHFSKIEWIKADITDVPSLVSAFKNITKVYHCAALISFDLKDYSDLKSINIEGTANIVNLCISNSIEKLCYVSTIAAIGKSNIESSFITEDTHWNPEEDHSVYAITKYGAEMEVWRGSQEGLDVVVVNPGIVLGSGFWRSGSGNLFKRIYKGVNYYTKGVTGYVDVSDVVKSMILLMESAIKNERYILVSENVSFNEFFSKTAETLNTKPPQKEVSRLLLNFAWRIDWLRSVFKSKRRRITKQLAESLLSTSYYDNSKIKDAIHLEFIKIDDSILKNSKYFLEDHL